MKEQPIKLLQTYTELPQNLYTKQQPSKVLNPSIALFNMNLANNMKLDTQFLTSKEGVEILSGNSILEGTTPIAQAYAGHQFGYFTRLGDGRAILLGEYQIPNGDLVDIQLKGSGRTPYSRGGDGKATLGPMLREYIISEAMYALGIPTTRSLAVISTGEKIIREELLPGAILVRIAKSHIRVGTFQYASKFGTDEDVKALADYTIKRHFIREEEDDSSKENPYLYLLKEVMNRQATLLAKWQLVGFVHGVMNTDNVSISGETIDYGPCAFMDEYEPNIVFSSIDTEGRYAYKNQPIIANWNLARFAETLLPLLHEKQEEAVRIAQEEISRFSGMYMKHWYTGMRNKLGLFNENEMDENLIEALLSMMQKYKVDFTNTFRDLTMGSYGGMELAQAEEFQDWLGLWQLRLMKQTESLEEVKTLMKKSNPTVIPRNHLVEEALEAAVEYNDYTVIDSLLESVSCPYDYMNKKNLDVKPPTNRGRYVTYCGT
jgi:serine/tyrosine/threonine adenylyltransferase